MTGRFVIEDVSPSVACGRYPAKAVVGERVPVAAKAYREGHEAFGDRYLTWRAAHTKEIDAGQGAAEPGNDLAEGAQLLAAAGCLPDEQRRRVRAAGAALVDTARPFAGRIGPALELAELLWRYPLRTGVTSSDAYPIRVDRPRALFSAWYEFFPRSESTGSGEVATLAEGRAGPVRHGAFATARERLADVAAMGFDVLYPPPMHPIGRVNRKGCNNPLVAGPEDAGPAHHRRPETAATTTPGAAHPTPLTYTPED
ncbi:maltotransferase domain-containing protein [Micromonospora sp. NPDC049559]|uniref:maltotransferase domain-containing protein n=1 Tax=Micromonospora sp. NPDC049559 TaxID=3155923 RepID=UPI00343F0D12